MAKLLTATQRNSEFYQQLKQREQLWWLSRQRLVVLKERQMFWFGDNSVMMWLLWQLVSYVIVAIILMLLNNLLILQLTLTQYAAIFITQTLILVIMLAFKPRLAKRIENDIAKEQMTSEQMLNEMTILADDSLFTDIHTLSPISLQQIYWHCNSQLRLISLQYLLQKEIDVGRLTLLSPSTKILALPIDLANDELTLDADKIIYKTLT